MCSHKKVLEWLAYFYYEAFQTWCNLTFVRIFQTKTTDLRARCGGHLDPDIYFIIYFRKLILRFLSGVQNFMIVLLFCFDLVFWKLSNLWLQNYVIQGYLRLKSTTKQKIYFWNKNLKRLLGSPIFSALENASVIFIPNILILSGCRSSHRSETPDSRVPLEAEVGPRKLFGGHDHLLWGWEPFCSQNLVDMVIFLTFQLDNLTF